MIQKIMGEGVGEAGVEHLGEGVGAEKHIAWRLAQNTSRMGGGTHQTDYRYFETLRRYCDTATAQDVLEIGIGPEAHSGRTFAQSMSHRLPARLVSVDIDPLRPRPEDERAVMATGVEWTVHIGDSLKANVEGMFDLLYIDGDHGYEYALGDFLRYEPHVRPGGYILVDDYPAFEGVCQAVTELERMGWYGLYLPYDTDYSGHVIYRKPGVMAPWVTDRNKGE